MSEPIRRVYKYATGEPIPPGAVYLSTVAQTMDRIPSTIRDAADAQDAQWVLCWLVWHYFLIEEAPEQT